MEIVPTTTGNTDSSLDREKSTSMEVLAFRMWLEVEIPDTTVNSPDGDAMKSVKFPITNLTITASLNSIPTATVGLAVGIDMKTNTVGIIHTADGKSLLQPFSYTYGKIYFRNLISGTSHIAVDEKGEVIFEGYINSTAESYSMAGTSVVLTMIHWAYGLDACPACNTIVHPLSSSDFSSMFYAHNVKTRAAGPSNNAADSAAVTTLSLIVSGKLNGEELRNDVIENGLLAVLKILNSWSDASHLHVIADISTRNGQRLEFDAGLKIKIAEILNTRLKTGDSTDAAGTYGLPQGVFPVLKLKHEGKQGDQIINAMYKDFFSAPAKELLMNSLWSSMVSKAGRFGFMIVPRVLEVRFITKRYVHDTAYPHVANPVVIQASVVHPRPIRAVITMPSALVSQGDKPNAPLHYGKYVSTTAKSGTLLIRNRPEWAANVPQMNLVATARSGDSTELATKDNRPAFVADNGFYDRLAEEAYWDTMFEGSQMVAVGPLRFDVCPGTMVKVIGFYNPVTPSSSDSYLGMVTTVKFTLDMEQATAITQYSLSHVRAEGNKLNDTAATAEHPIYDCKPFSGATWTEKYINTTMPSADIVRDAIDKGGFEWDDEMEDSTPPDSI
jgi:hypothetical protein